MSYSPQDWKRVDEVLEAARVRLRPPLGWREVALKAGLSVEGIRIIRRGLVDEPRPDNVAKIEAALQLPAGTIANVLRDPDFPMPAAATETEAEPEPRPETEPDTVAAIMSDDRLTDDDKARLVDYYERLRIDDNNGSGRRHA